MRISGDWRDSKWFLPAFLTVGGVVPGALTVMLDDTYADQSRWLAALALLATSAAWATYLARRMRSQRGVRRH